MAKEKVDLSNLINAESSRNKTAIIGMAIARYCSHVTSNVLCDAHKMYFQYILALQYSGFSSKNTSRWLRSEK